MKIFYQSAFEKWPFDDNSVQAVITSPPYYMVRKYDIPDVMIGGDSNCQHEWVNVNLESIASSYCPKCKAFYGQYGHEPIPFGDEYGYLEHTMLWIKEAWRVLKKGGLIFIVIDDKYNGSTGVNVTHIKRKSKLLIPERLMIAMQEQGWCIRNSIRWLRTMPEPVKDRFAAKSETIIMATNSDETTWWNHLITDEWTDTRPEPDYIWWNKVTGEETKEEPEGWQTEEGKKVWTRINLWKGFDYLFDLTSVKEAIRADVIKRYMYGFNSSKYSDKEKSSAGLSSLNQNKFADKIMSALGLERKTKIKAEDAEMFSSPRAKYHRKTNKPIGIYGGGNYKGGGINSPESVYKQKIRAGDKDVLSVTPGDVWLQYYLDVTKQLINEIGVDGYIEALKSQILHESDIFPQLVEGLRDEHYAPYSQKLVERLILCSTRPGDIVVDPFCGSGTTLRVADRLNRIGYGLDLGYEDVQKRRLELIQKQLL